MPGQSSSGVKNNGENSKNLPEKHALVPLFFSLFDSLGDPRPSHCWGFEITLTHTTLGRTTPARRWNISLTTSNTHKRQNPSPAGFEPAVLASFRPHTYVFDRTATGIGPVPLIRHEFYVRQDWNQRLDGEKAACYRLK